jgi:hypothetical protein
MASLLQQLENNEAVLLMYIADELPPEDRREVEQMLATDAGLRAELARLDAAYHAAADALARGDPGWRPAVPEGVAVRRFTQALRQWHAAQAQRPPAEAPLREIRLAWWAYPAAAAAAVLLGFLVWWGNTDNLTTPNQNRVVQNMPFNPYGPGDGPAGGYARSQDYEEWVADALASRLEWSLSGSEAAGGPDADAAAAGADGDEAPDEEEDDAGPLLLSLSADESLPLFLGDASDDTDGSGQDDIQ